jgi:hypothetical protein
MVRRTLQIIEFAAVLVGHDASKTSTTGQDLSITRRHYTDSILPSSRVLFAKKTILYRLKSGIQWAVV